MKKENLTEYNNGSLWSLAEEENFLLGITQSGLDQAGSIIAIDLSEAGDEYDAGDWIGEVRGKDLVLEIVAPFDLRLIERNEEILEQPSILEDDPTGDAWMLKVEKRND